MTNNAGSLTSNEIVLREVIDSDLDVFFEQQLNEEANWMAAFTAPDPSDRTDFDLHWRRIRADQTVLIRTILFNGKIAGSVLKYEDEGHPEMSYWLGREFWSKGIATRALQMFLEEYIVRPVYARAARDNLASLRVLEKCAFCVIDENSGYANARGAVVEELLLRLD